MNKFTLPSGTTNRHQWHKTTVKALQELDRLRFQRLELFGINGGEEHSSITQVMFSDVENQTAEDLLNAIGNQYKWLITKETAADILHLVSVALPVAREAMPVIDNRRTLDQDAERIRDNNEREQVRQAEQTERQKDIDAITHKLHEQYPWAVADNGKLSGQARAAKNMKLACVTITSQRLMLRFRSGTN